MSKRKTHEKYVSELRCVNSSIIVLERYKTAHTKILHKCRMCGYDWNVEPHCLLKGVKCPVCTGKQIGPSPQYQNSIWSKDDYREIGMFYGLSEDFMKSTMVGSGRKILIKCPNCGNLKEIDANTLLHKGFGCKHCSNKRSYAEKYMSSVFNQINIEYIPEYAPEWANNKRYDFYLPHFNCIVEVNGIQHYTNSFLNRRDEAENDKLKQQLAQDNGILNYLIIDCRRSEAQFVKDNIILSNLLNILNKNTEDINWIQCEIDARKTLSSEICELWNNGCSLQTIKNKVNKSYAYVIKILEQGNQRAVICYTEDEVRKRSKNDPPPKRNKPNIHTISVLQYDLFGKFIKKWDSISVAAQQLKISPKSIINSCRGVNTTGCGYIWKYADKTISEKFLTVEQAVLRLNDPDKYKHNVRRRNPQAKKVNQYDLNGCLIKTWNCIADAAEGLNIKSQNIGACCRKKQKTCGGYIWKYSMNNNKEERTYEL